MANQNLTLLTDLYELTMMQGYFNEQSNDTVIFDAFYRKNPSGSGYAIAAGLQQIIDYVKNLSFTYDDIDYLRGLGIFSEDFLEYLAGFHFTGDIYAIPEGTVVFPREPLVKVIAPIMEAQLVETALLNIINHQSLIATKSNRIVRAGDTFYLLTDTGVECLSTDGTSQWTQSLSARPQGLLADRRQLLVFCGNTVQGLTPPAAENNAQSNT